MKTLEVYTSPSCGPCRMIKPIIEKFDGETEDVTVTFINIAEDPDATTGKDITVVPTLIVTEDGTEVKRHIGARLTVEDLTELVN